MAATGGDMMLLAVNFHYIGERAYPHPGIYPVTPAVFERQLDELGRHFDFVGLTDIAEAAAGRASLPDRACLITFDDGLREQYELAWPILRRRGIAAAFFVNTLPHVTGRAAGVHKVHYLRAHTPPDAFLRAVEEACDMAGIVPGGPPPDESILAAQYRYDPPQVRRLKHLLNFRLSPRQGERLIDALFARRWEERAFAEELYMTADHWRELAAAGCLGTHSHSHRPLGELSSHEAAGDLRLGVEALAKVTGARPLAVSYPYGGPSAVTRSVADAAASLGLQVGFTMERAMNHDLADPLLLARADTNDVPGGKRPLFEVHGSGSGAEVVFRDGFADRRGRYGGVHA